MGNVNALYSLPAVINEEEDKEDKLPVEFSINAEGKIDVIITEGKLDTLFLGERFPGFADGVQIIDRTTEEPYHISRIQYDEEMEIPANEDGWEMIPSELIEPDNDITFVTHENEYHFVGGKLKSVSCLDDEETMILLPYNCPELTEDFQVLVDGEKHPNCDSIISKRNFSSFEEAKKYQPEGMKLSCHVNNVDLTFKQGVITFLDNGPDHFEVPKDMPPMVDDDDVFVGYLGESSFDHLPVKCEFRDGKICRMEASGKIDLLHLGNDFPGFTDDYKVIDTDTNEEYRIPHFEYAWGLKYIGTSRMNRTNIF